jgi:RimJ/RimL family protein N-acetyltransferase
MSAPKLAGPRVSLGPIEGQTNLSRWATWFRDEEFQHGLDAGSPILFNPVQLQSWLEKNTAGRILLGIFLQEDAQLIGFFELSGFDWTAHNAWVAIGIGERALWGQGLGREAMQLGLGYAFEVLNLWRVNLSVHAYNQRAYRSYLHCGFQEEGRGRQVLLRFGQRWDMIYMGILREEWASRQG